MNQKLADLDFCKKPLQSSEIKKNFLAIAFREFLSGQPTGKF